MAITVISLISNDLFSIFFQMNGSIFTKVAKTFLIVDLIMSFQLLLLMLNTYLTIIISSLLLFNSIDTLFRQSDGSSCSFLRLRQHLPH